MNKSYILLFAAALALNHSIRAADLTNVNVSFMLRGYCLAGSRVDKQAIGGFGQSDNAPKKVTAPNIGRDGQLALVAFPQKAVSFAYKYRGMRMLLINRTKREVEFPASDSRISILQEAQDSKGDWKPIEYLPFSWCGNSSHRVFLPAGHYWEFAAPVYTGTKKTKLRFVLQGKQPLYSNEFEGSINPGQFTQKQGHTPTDIMDPYNE
jgi:hypothetical protein